MPCDYSHDSSAIVRKSESDDGNALSTQTERNAMKVLTTIGMKHHPKTTLQDWRKNKDSLFPYPRQRKKARVCRHKFKMTDTIPVGRYPAEKKERDGSPAPEKKRGAPRGRASVLFLISR